MLRLSIITTLYNSARYLPKCLDSLINQDIPKDEYEIILVNDGSPDNSEEIARDYAERTENIKVISQANKGLAGARNTGIRAAEGKYIYFVDPDDYILENSLSCLIDRMDNDNLDILRFGYTEVDEDYRPTRSCKHPEQPDYSAEVMDGNSFLAKRLGTNCYVWTFIFQAKLIKDNILFFTEGSYFDDTPWLPQVMRCASRVDSIDFKRHFYLIRSNSLVQAANASAITKKLDGQKYLIEELHRQMESAGNDNAIQWYKSMIAHCVVTMLSLAASLNKDQIKSCSHYISDSNVLPLSIKSGLFENRLKISIINLSPSLFCKVLRTKSLLK